MGYIWLIYFSSMALAFWFAMTLMYDGDEVTKNHQEILQSKMMIVFDKPVGLRGLKKQLRPDGHQGQSEYQSKGVVLVQPVKTQSKVKTKMSTCASNLYLQCDRIWLPAKSCQPFSAAWHGWVASKGVFLLFLTFFKASNIKVEMPCAKTLVDGFHYQIIFSRILCNAEVKLQVCWLWVSWLVTLALDLLALLQRRHMFMLQRWLSAIQLCWWFFDKAAMARFFYVVRAQDLPDFFLRFSVSWMFGRNLGEARFRNPTKHLGRVQEAYMWHMRLSFSNCRHFRLMTHDSSIWYFRMKDRRMIEWRSTRLRLWSCKTCSLLTLLDQKSKFFRASRWPSIRWGSTGLHLPLQKVTTCAASKSYYSYNPISPAVNTVIICHNLRSFALEIRIHASQPPALAMSSVLCAGPKGCLRRGVWQWKEHHYGLAGAFLWSHCWGRIGEQSRPQESQKKKQWNCIWHPDWFGFQQRFHSQQGARPKDGFFFTTSPHITARQMEGIWISSPTASRLDMLARRDQDHMLKLYSVKREYHFIGSTSRFMSCTRTSQGAGSLRHQRPSEYHAGMQWSHRGGRCVAWISCLQRSVLQMWMPPKIWRSFYLAVDTSHFFLLRQKPRHFHVKAVSIALADGTINFTQDLKAAAKNAQLDFIQNLPQQFDTYVGSGGLLCSTKWVCKKTAGETHDVKLRLHLFLSTNHISFGSTDSLSIFYVSVCFRWLEPKVSVLWWSKATHCNC